MLAYMLDTNIFIHLMKGFPDSLRQRLNAHADEVCISAITLCELYFGAEKSARRTQNMKAIEEFTARLDVLTFTPKAALHYGQLRADLERAGTPIGANDMLIAAHARSEGLIIVTNNSKEFDRVAGLRVENWI